MLTFYSLSNISSLNISSTDQAIYLFCNSRFGSHFTLKIPSLTEFDLSSSVPESNQFGSVQDGFYALRKAHMCSTLSLRSFHNVAFEMVPVFLWLMMALFVLSTSRKIILHFLFQCLFLQTKSDQMISNTALSVLLSNNAELVSTTSTTVLVLLILVISTI